MQQFVIHEITANGSVEITPTCFCCQELLSLSNGDHVYQNLHAANLERHLNSAHSHQFVAKSDRIMDGGWYATIDNNGEWRD